MKERHMDKKRLFLAARIAVYLTAAGLLLWWLYRSPYNPHPSSAEDVRRWVAGFGALAPAVYVALYTVRPLLFFPALLLNLSAGVIFGPALGIVLVLAGGLGCASFCYLLGRFGGGSWLLDHLAGESRLVRRLRAYLGGEGCFVKMLWLRTVPVFPYDPVSLIAGSLRLPYRTYAGATLLGMLPGAVAYNLLADSFGTARFYLALAVTALAFGVPLLLWRRGGRRL